MDVEEKRDRLYQIAASDPDPARRAEARQRLAALPTKTAETSQRPVNLSGGQRDPNPSTVQAGPRPNLLSRINAMGPSGDTNDAMWEGAARLVNGASGGISDALLDTAASVTDNPRQFRDRREAFQAENQAISNALSVGGGFTPGSVPARIGGKVEAGVTSAYKSLSPKLQALIGPTMARLAGGAAAGATIGATQGGLGAEPGQRLQGAGIGAAEGGLIGGGLAAVGAGAEAAANALRNDDIALLEKYGLRPSMVPGTPVTAEGASVRENIRNPPLGTHTAGPETRQAAGIRAAQTILPDLVARGRANSEQIATERAGNLVSGVAQRPILYTPAAVEAENLMSEPGALPAVRSSLGVVANRLAERASPRIPGTNQPAPGATIPAGELQDIASMSHDLADPEAYGAPGKPQLKLLGGRLHSQLPPEMLDQDARFAQSAQNMERARESLSLESADLRNPQGGVPLAALRKAGNLIGRHGEGTKAAATADLGVERIREEGPPEVMTGPGGGPSHFAPGQVDYATAIDQPALHVAQENLQLNPSAVFSGGGTHGILHRLGGAGARRFLYPPLRGAGNAGVGRTTGPALTLLDALRLQLKQDELSGNEGE